MGVTCTMCRISPAELARASEDDVAAKLRYGADGCLDLDKAWDGIAWLISDERRRERMAMLDPQTIETKALFPVETIEAVGGKIGYVDPKLVAKIAAVLAPIDEATLRKRFDAKAMRASDVYPEIWDDGDDALEYVLGHFEDMRELYRAAAAAGDCVLVRIE